MSEIIFCPQCSGSNEKGKEFCNNCGESIGEDQTTGNKVAQQSSINQKQSPMLKKILGICGLVIGIISVVVLSWIEVYARLLWTPFLFLGIAIIGSIFSAIAFREYKIIGITGLVISLLGGLIQIMWLMFYGLVILMFTR